ncbi:hypothetical protein Droror1_Dr00012813 [Drosera rotundifolia]
MLFLQAAASAGLCRRRIDPHSKPPPPPTLPPAASPTTAIITSPLFAHHHVSPHLPHHTTLGMTLGIIELARESSTCRGARWSPGSETVAGEQDACLGIGLAGSCSSWAGRGADPSGPPGRWFCANGPGCTHRKPGSYFWPKEIAAGELHKHFSPRNNLCRGATPNHRPIATTPRRYFPPQSITKSGHPSQQSIRTFLILIRGKPPLLSHHPFIAIHHPFTTTNDTAAEALPWR